MVRHVVDGHEGFLCICSGQMFRFHESESCLLFRFFLAISILSVRVGVRVFVFVVDGMAMGSYNTIGIGDLGRHFLLLFFSSFFRSCAWAWF